MLKAIQRHWLFKFFASLKLAVISLLLLAAVLAVATVLESYYGTRAVHVLVYGTWWFDGVLGLLGANVFCAALARYPWKKSQTGFVITHSGILIILLGSVLTQRYGVDGNLPVLEGQEDGEVILSDLRLTVSDEEGRRQVSYPVPETALKSQGRLMEIGFPGSSRIVVDQFLPRAVFERRMVASPVPGVGLPAMHVELFNSRFRVDQWLQPLPDQAMELNLGPAVLSFRKLWAPGDEATFFKPEEKKAEKKSKYGYVTALVNGREYRVDIASAMKGFLPIEGTPFKLKVERYLPYAIVQNNELVNKANDPVNPAVQVTLESVTGVQEFHTLFANFPEFATLHKKKLKPGQDPLGVKLQMVGNGPTPEMKGQGRGQLFFAQTSDDKELLYLVKGKAGDLKTKGRVKVGEAIPTGWMDLQFKVTDWLPAAVEDNTPKYVEQIAGSDANFLSGLRLRIEDGKAPAPRTTATASLTGEKEAVASSAADSGIWLAEGQAKPLTVGGHGLYVQFSKRRLMLPFQLYLEKFTVGTDPGTTKAAAYESRVVVKDAMATGEPKRALISMNEPLVYGGYTFYQASYQMEEGRPPVSVFSVNYDPGRIVKYVGSLVMVLGIMLMFWWNPHYMGKITGRQKEEKVAT